MKKPVAVIISDVHYSLKTLELADAAMRLAIAKANNLDVPVNFLFNSGMTTPTAFAAPVELGIMFSKIPRPPRQSLLLGPSTVF